MSSSMLRRALAALLLVGCAPALGSEDDGAGEGPTHSEPLALSAPDPAVRGEVAELVDAPARPTRTIAALMFDIGRGPPVVADIQQLLTGDGSLREMYREISYGMQDLEIDLLGPYTLPEQTCLPIECCGPKTNQPNGPAVQDIIAALPKTYDHYFWVYGPLPQGANCGTWGDEGRPGQYAKYSSYSFHSIVGYTQELGHNFGMTHEPIMTCPNQAMFLDDPSQCTHSEYGSQLSFMGSGPMETSGYHKVSQGWLSACNGVTVGGSGTYTLLPTEIPCDGTQILQVQAPKSRMAPMAGDRQGRAPTLTHYYLELRSGRGFDARYPTPQVFISVGPDFNTTQSAPYVYQLNRTPDTNGGNRPSLSDGGYTTGQTFDDPAGGLTFTFDSVTADQAMVTITRTAAGGADTCLDGSAFAAPGAGPESCGLPVSGTGGAGGMAGAGGASAGASGASGAGAGGVAGAAGLGGGAGGASGAGGAGGLAGAGGAPAGAGGAGVSGSGPAAGSSGAGALSGAAGTLGGGAGVAGSASGASGGVSQAGTGGAGAPVGGAGPSAGPVATDTQLDGGCGCRAAGTSPGRGGWLLLAAVAAAGTTRRRRATRSLLGRAVA